MASRDLFWWLFRCLILGALFVLPSLPVESDAQGLCLECHGKPGVAKSTRGDVQTDLYVDRKVFRASSHGRFQCTECHRDAFKQHRSATKRLTPVDCARCHQKSAKVFQESVHGQALFRRDAYAPRCHHCHGQHDILPSRNPKSHTYPMNIPSVCSACHREGAKMMKVHDISQRDAVAAYSMSIHGKGIFKRGLIVSAVCTSCHGSHLILKHQNKRSSIHHDNVSKTCKKCHVQIERVHKKVVRGALWKKKGAIAAPSCIDCHPPHRVRRVFYEFDLPDETCLKCHQKKDLTMVKGGEKISLYVDKKKLIDSAHAKVPCIKCHVDASKRHDPPCKDAKKVDCSMCHAGAVRDHQLSVHGTLQARGSPDAPTCTLCHGTHGIQLKGVVTSPTFPRNVPKLCARCHQEGQKAAKLYKGRQHDIIKSYVESIHGKGLIKSGLVVTAKCTDCHSTHRILRTQDPRSTVNPKNVSRTCAKCHLGIFEAFKSSIHSPEVTKSDKKLPSCYDCHQSHKVSRVDESNFRQGIYNQCGKCHEDVAKTYFDTLHGKVSKLGTAKAAKCHDCHGSHNVLPVTNPKSTLSFWNIVGTCKKCHANANRKFTGYLTHATHHNRSKYPALFYTFWFMTILLVSTLSFFGLHTLMWLPRSIREARKRRKRHREEAQAMAAAAAGMAEPPVYYMRFTPFERSLHILVIVSFLSLALTGMTLKFPDLGFFNTISRALGGYEVTGLIHRLAAIITFTYFALHLGQMFLKIRRRTVSLKEMFVGENSMVPKKRDLVEFWQTMKYFVGKGPKPQYGRWTYWEKFDYLAVFWGVAIIGLSGLILWFPEQFTVIFPGWMINVASVIHSDEALLATGFIFTIHFFNTHLRPEAFPMDPVIFTGRVPLEEMKEDRPREYQWLVENGKLEGRLTGPPPVWLKRLAYIGGLTFLAIGVTLVVAIVYAMLVFYT